MTTVVWLWGYEKDEYDTQERQGKRQNQNWIPL